MSLSPFQLRMQRLASINQLPIDLQPVNSGPPVSSDSQSLLEKAQELAQQVQEILPPDLVERLPSELGDLLNPPEEGSTPSD